jgi:hypothetical protein
MYNKVSFLRLFFATDVLALAFFFRSHAAFETLRPLLQNGTCMPSCMYNKSFFSWIIFYSLIFGYFLFLSMPCCLGNVEDAAALWVPHVILYEQ